MFPFVGKTNKKLNWGTPTRRKLCPKGGVSIESARLLSCLPARNEQTGSPCLQERLAESFFEPSQVFPRRVIYVRCVAIASVLFQSLQLPLKTPQTSAGGLPGNPKLSNLPSDLGEQGGRGPCLGLPHKKGALPKEIGVTTPNLSGLEGDFR